MTITSHHPPPVSLPLGQCLSMLLGEQTAAWKPELASNPRSSRHQLCAFAHVTKWNSFLSPSCSVPSSPASCPHAVRQCARGSNPMPEPSVHGLSLPGSLFERTTVILCCGHSIHHGCPHCQNLSGSLYFSNTDGIGKTWLCFYLCTTQIQNDFSPIKTSLTSKIKRSFTPGVLFTY